MNRSDSFANGKTAASADSGQSMASQGNAKLLTLVAEQITDQAHQHPYRAVGAAFGLGYVVGAGLPPFVARFGRILLLRSLVEAFVESDAALGIVRRLWQGNDSPEREQGSMGSGAQTSSQRSRRERKKARQAQTSGSIH